MDWSRNWDGSINASPADSPRSPISTCVYRRRVRKDFLHQKLHQRLWRQSNRRVSQQRQERDLYNGPETQYVLVQLYVAGVSKYVWIARKIALCVTPGFYV